MSFHVYSSTWDVYSRENMIQCNEAFSIVAVFCTGSARSNTLCPRSLAKSCPPSTRRSTPPRRHTGRGQSCCSRTHSCRHVSPCSTRETSPACSIQWPARQPNHRDFDVPLNSPLHRVVRNNERRDNEENLVLRAAEDVEDRGIERACEGVLSVRREGICGDALLLGGSQATPPA